MKDKLLRFLSYVVVAMLATAITLQMTVKTGTGKLDRLENLIQERYIGEADGEAMEDAAAADETFALLMGEKVEPRREFIEKNAKYVMNLDV